MGKKKEQKKPKAKTKTAIKSAPQPKVKRSILGRKRKDIIIPTDQIEKRAYLIWESEGCPQGKHEQHWKQAEEELNRELRV